jgi:peptide/nickel transport system permease protein
MSDIELSATPQASALPLLSNFKRVAMYVLLRLLTLTFALVVGVFLTIFVANLGGYLDTVVRANIEESLGSMIQAGWLKDVTDDVERQAIIEQMRTAMEQAAGLNRPFLLRCVQWLWKGLTLDWGMMRSYYAAAQGSQPITVSAAILDALPRTLLVFGSANVLLFLVSIVLALRLARRHGSWQDRLVSALAPLAAAPSWVYGIVISLVLMYGFHIYLRPFMTWPPITDLKYAGFYLRFMLPPIVAIFISKFFQSIYAWRTVFLVNSSEEYVQTGVAKGLPNEYLERRYILRPMLPNVLTSFALMLVGLWQEVVLLEIVFNVGGVGQMMMTAVRFFDVRLLVALVVTFAYLLVITVFLLDVLYALVDPRVKIGGLSSSLSASKPRPNLRNLLRRSTPLPRVTLPPLAASERETPHRLQIRMERQLRLGQGLHFLLRHPGVLVGWFVDYSGSDRCIHLHPGANALSGCVAALAR